MIAATNSDWPVGIAEIIDRKGLLKRLATRRPLRVKWGIDPTSPGLHLGHAAVLRVLRWFQDQGHQLFLVIGDFTARIGDPSGVNTTRPVLSPDEIKANLADYFDQLGQLLDMSRVELVYNRDWLEPMTLADFLDLAMKFSLNSIIERDDFRSRLKNHHSVGLHEVIYSLAQAYDSVHLKADVEVGGVDQRLNLLTGRELQGKLGQEPQELVLIKLLVGVDGVKKMSKTAGNFIGLNQSSDQMFGQLMSIPDSAIATYAELAAGLTPPLIAKLPSHPKEAKQAVATAVIASYFGQTKAEETKRRFQKGISDKDPQAQKELAIEITTASASPTAWSLVAACVEASGSAAQRLINQKAVKLNGRELYDPRQKLTIKNGDLLQVGRHRFFRLAVK